MPFKKDDPRINRGGRPKGARNRLTEFKEEFLRALQERKEEMWDVKKTKYAHLLRVWASIMPKDLKHSGQPTNITYISHTPRPEGTIDDKGRIDSKSLGWEPIEDKDIIK